MSFPIVTIEKKKPNLNEILYDIGSQRNRLASSVPYVRIAGGGKKMHVGACFPPDWDNSHSAFQTVPESMRTSSPPGSSQLCLHTLRQQTITRTYTHGHTHARITISFKPSTGNWHSVHSLNNYAACHGGVENTPVHWEQLFSPQEPFLLHSCATLYWCWYHLQKKWWRCVEEKVECWEKQKFSPKASCLLLSQNTIHVKLILQHFRR